ncbi:MAG TPA: hypothetical protein VJL29_04210, partial [Thermoguttaceae bacterium]|nr:hypothetical protein [Thermoguttaceae bacterium]
MKTPAFSTTALILLALATAAPSAAALDITNSVTVNGIELQVIRQANPVAGLESYCVRAMTDSAELNTLYLNQPAIDGIVHQCQQKYSGVWKPTVLVAQIRAGEASNPSWTASGWTDLHTAADTHILLSEDMSDLLIFGNSPPVEGNDGANPFGLNTNNGLTRIGLGQITGSTDYSISVNNYPDSEIDIMQVVIPANTAVYFSGEVIGYLGGSETLSANFSNVQVGVPEPGTLLLLAAGALCVV